MILGNVMGAVVSTVKYEQLRGEKLLVVQPVDLEDNPAGLSFIALDRVSAGKGDKVIVNREGGGTKLMYGEALPVQAVIVAVVDRVHIEYHDD